MLPTYSERDIKRAKKEVYRYIRKDYNSRGVLGSANGREMPKNLKSAILYESAYDSCLWSGCDWTDLSGNGCRFSFCDFALCDIHNAALQHSLFDSAVFNKCDIRGSNFAYSLFTWSILSRTPVEGCAFTGAVFNHATLQDCEVAHSNFELCKFQNTVFKNIDFRNLALKYAFFQDVSMENVALPFLQMPYTFGGLQYIFSTTDSIRIASMDSAKANISVDEYRKKLPQLIVFFASEKDYFPLANCYLANGQREFAIGANKEGIVNSAATHDFRKLYFFCVQAAQELGLSRAERSRLYDRLHQLITVDRMTQSEYHEFRHYFPRIKQVMFDNPYNQPTMAISLHTNIAADDYENLGLLLRALDEAAENCGVRLDSKHIEIRHNSPNVLGWFPTGDIDQLLQLLQGTWVAIKPILSATLQNTSSVLSLITGAYSVRQMIANRAKSDAKKAAAPKSKSRLDGAAEAERSAENSELHMLREELQRQELLWQRKERGSLAALTPFPESVGSKLREQMEKLRVAGICIDTMEIQLLDDRCDILDVLSGS